MIGGRKPKLFTTLFTMRNRDRPGGMARQCRRRDNCLGELVLNRVAGRAAFCLAARVAQRQTKLLAIAAQFGALCSCLVVLERAQFCGAELDRSQLFVCGEQGANTQSIKQLSESAVLNLCQKGVLDGDRDSAATR